MEQLTPLDPEAPFVVQFSSGRTLSPEEIEAFDIALFQQPFHWSEYLLEASGEGTISFITPGFDEDELREVQQWLGNQPLVLKYRVVPFRSDDRAT